MLKLGSPGAVSGIKSPQFKQIKALSGVSRRDYNYDVFWVVFPIVDENGNTMLADNIAQLELVVGIYSKEGRVSWQMPESVRTKIKEISKTNLMEKK